MAPGTAVSLVSECFFFFGIFLSISFFSFSTVLLDGTQTIQKDAFR